MLINKKTAEKYLLTLKQLYPEAKCALHYSTPWQLLVATILSAQCTDKTVNKVTSILFADHPTVYDMQKLPIKKLKEYIFSSGFYNSKAKYIKDSAEKVINNFAGEVPKTMNDLLTLTGVSRKTANVVLSVGFGINEGVVVDTHVKRLANRLCLTKQQDPKKIEQDIMSHYKNTDWERISTLLIHHGRNICYARKPNCAECKLNKTCPAAFKFTNPEK